MKIKILVALLAIAIIVLGVLLGMKVAMKKEDTPTIRRTK